MTAAFHIHGDFQILDPATEVFLATLGMVRTDFLETEVEPFHHFTGKFARHERDEWMTAGQALRHHIISAGPLTMGYMEAEVIRDDTRIPSPMFNPTVPIPFRLQLGTPAPGTFKQAELHIAMSHELSDPRLAAALKQMGFVRAVMPKWYGTQLIWTTAGTHAHINQVRPLVEAYLRNAGGCVNASIQDERIALWGLTTPAHDLPPVIQEIVMQ